MKSVVLLSGGVDSAVALALSRNPVEAITFNYGQRHHKEINAAKQIAEHYGVQHRIFYIDPLLFEDANSSLTNSNINVPEGHAEEPDATYVPARNLVMLSFAAARAESIGAREIVIGCNADDAGAYPDCRRDFIEQYRDVLQRGTVGHTWLSAPLIGSTKRRVLSMAKSLDVPLRLTWSCYRGGPVPCRRCGACVAIEQAL